jgi:hypothetical protein
VRLCSGVRMQKLHMIVYRHAKHPVVYPHPPCQLEKKMQSGKKEGKARTNCMPLPSPLGASLHVDGGGGRGGISKQISLFIAEFVANISAGKFNFQAELSDP